MDFDLKGRVAIVTGGNRGIGRAVANALAAEGTELAIAARDMRLLERVACDLRAKHGVRVLPISYDSRDRAQVDRMVAQTAEEFGRIDILVNNGAPAGGGGTRMEELTDEYLMEGNLDPKVMGYFRCLRAVVPYMREQGFGRIVNVAGVAARQAFAIPGAMRNAAVTAMGKAASFDLGSDGITVTTVHPGSVYDEDVVGGWGRATSLDMANVVTFLSSPRAACLTGEAIAVASGHSG